MSVLEPVVGQPDPDWRRRYFDLLCRATDQDHSDAEALKDRNLPARIFKYRSPTKRAIQSLRAGTVWLADASTFNDPIDSSFLVDLERHLAVAFVREMGKRAFSLTDGQLHALVAGFGTTRQAMAALLRNDRELTAAQGAHDAEILAASTVQAASERAAKMRAEWQRGTKVSCFSEIGDSVLMWAHYADQHRGFCVEYDVARVERRDRFRESLVPVLYARQRVDVAQVLSSMTLSRTNGANFPPVPLLAAMVKGTDWEYEREWRLVEFEPDRAGGVERPTPKPRAVYLGCRMETKVRRKIVALSAKSGIPTYEMTVSEATMGLTSQRTEN